MCCNPEVTLRLLKTCSEDDETDLLDLDSMQPISEPSLTPVDEPSVYEIAQKAAVASWDQIRNAEDNNRMPCNAN